MYLRQQAPSNAFNPYAYTTGPASGPPKEVAAMDAKRAAADNTVWGVGASMLKAGETCSHTNPVFLDPQQQNFSNTLGEGLVCDKSGHMTKFACVPRKEMLLPGKVSAPSFSRTPEQCAAKCDPVVGYVSGPYVVPEDKQLCLTKTAGINPQKLKQMRNDLHEGPQSLAPYPATANSAAGTVTSSYLDNQEVYTQDRGNWGWQLHDTIELTGAILPQPVKPTGANLQQ